MDDHPDRTDSDLNRAAMLLATLARLRRIERRTLALVRGDGSDDVPASLGLTDADFKAADADRERAIDWLRNKGRL